MRIGYQAYEKVKIVPITPLHIGTGEEIEPFEYTIKNNQYYRIDFKRFFECLPEKKQKELLEISKIPSVRTVMRVRTFIRDNFDADNMSKAIMESHDVKTTIVNKFNKLLNDLANNDPKNEQINELSIMEVYRSGTEIVVPGSSVKGAIRTAIFDKILSKDISEEKKREELKFFHGNNDPLDSLRVSDAIREKKDISIGYFINAPKDKFNKELIKGGLSVLTEVVRPAKVFKGDIRIVKDETVFNKNNKYFQIIRQSIKDIDSIFRICNEHYLPIFKKEYSMIKKASPQNPLIKRMEDNKYLEQIEKNEIGLIRVGRHSGAEAVTIEGRKIKIRTRTGYRDENSSTTSWYFSPEDAGKINSMETVSPCGWAVIKRDV